MPISWKELGKLTSAAEFTVETARRYLEKRKTDPWDDFERSRVDLRKSSNGSPPPEEIGHGTPRLEGLD